MKSIKIIFLLTALMLGNVMSEELNLVVIFGKVQNEIVATCNHSKYTLKKDSLNSIFLLDQLTKKSSRGHISAILSRELSFKEYYLIKSYLDRFGYTTLKFYLFSKCENFLSALEVEEKEAVILFKDFIRLEPNNNNNVK